MTNKLLLRPIQPNDYSKQYLQLLELLTFIEPETISFDDFLSFLSKLTNNHQIWVIEDLTTNKIIGSVTILIENKLIHNLGKACHIEDVVVDKTVRGLGLGRMLVDKAVEIATEQKCYKTILDCAEHNEAFYEKCGFIKKGTQMALYTTY